MGVTVDLDRSERGGPVRVALVSHQLDSSTPTGVDRYGRELARALAVRTDVDLTLCAPNERGALHQRPSWAPDDVRLARVRGPRRAVVAGWTLLQRPRVDRVIGPVDLVHVTLPLYPCPTRFPLVCTVHDLFPVQHPEWYSRRDRFTVSRALRQLADAAAVIAVSSWTAEAVSDLPWVDARRVHVVPEGVGGRFAEPPEPVQAASARARLGVREDGYLLFVGQLAQRKQVPLLVEAVALARDPLPLVLVGPDGDAAAEVARRARELGIDHLIRRAGFVPDTDLHALLHGARALLHPCPDEGFGLTVLEAMAAGTATAVADAGALPETAGGAALLCRSADPSDWARAIDALADDATVGDLVRRGRDRARALSWSAAAGATLEVYGAVLGRAADGTA